MERIHEMLRMGKKRIPHNLNNKEDGKKLEPRILKETGQDLREHFSGLQMLRVKMRNAMKNFEILRTNDKRKVELKMEIIGNNLGEGM